jgi:hypothetical protein
MMTQRLWFVLGHLTVNFKAMRPSRMRRAAAHCADALFATPMAARLSTNWRRNELRTLGPA